MNQKGWWKVDENQNESEDKAEFIKHPQKRRWNFSFGFSLVYIVIARLQEVTTAQIFYIHWNENLVQNAL